VPRRSRTSAPDRRPGGRRPRNGRAPARTPESAARTGPPQAVGAATQAGSASMKMTACAVNLRCPSIPGRWRRQDSDAAIRRQEPVCGDVVEQGSERTARQLIVHLPIVYRPLVCAHSRLTSLPGQCTARLRRSRRAQDTHNWPFCAAQPRLTRQRQAAHSWQGGWALGYGLGGDGARVRHHGLPSQAAKTRTGVPARNEGRGRAATQPVSAGFELVPLQEA
jgi:hypothetical protein